MSNNVNPYITDTNPSTNYTNHYQPPNHYVPSPINQSDYQPPVNYIQQNYPPPPPVPNVYNQNIQPVRPNPVILQNNVMPINPIFPPTNLIICRFCSRETHNYMRFVSGSVTWSWCCCLFFFTGILCFIPFCMTRCKDRQLVCVVCQATKARQPANCC